MDEPLPLRSSGLIERTVEGKQKRVGETYRVITVALQIRKALEVVREGNLLIAIEVMVPESRINRNLFCPPYRGFLVPDLPIIQIVALVDNIAAHGNE